MKARTAEVRENGGWSGFVPVTVDPQGESGRGSLCAAAVLAGVVAALWIAEAVTSGAWF